MNFFVSEQLGEHQAKTPEGFLLCTDVPITRVGAQLYGPGETPIKPGPNGHVTVYRKADEVFAPETMASGQGKPVVNEHPADDVTPANYRKLSMGHMINLRRGQGAYDDLLLADLLITDPELIQDIISKKKREVSCGYDADYFGTGDGEGEQRNIRINHLALVEQGRCGPRCAIGDQAPRKETVMSKFGGALRRAFKAKDEAELSKIEEEMGGKMMGEDGEPTGEAHTHIHLHGAGGPTVGGGTGMDEEKEDEEEDPMEARFKKLEDGHSKIMGAIDAINKKLDGGGEEPDGDEPEGEGMDKAMKDKRGKDKKAKDEEAEEKEDKEIEGELKEEAPPGTGDMAAKAKDSAYLVDSFQRTVSNAEILQPGVRLPTFDRAASPKKTYDSICQFRLQVLDVAFTQQGTREILEGLTNGASIKTMDCARLRTVFDAAATIKRQKTNGTLVTAAIEHGAGGGTGIRGALKTPADLNRLNAARYAQ